VLALIGLRRAWPRLGQPERAACIIPLVAYPLVYYLVGYVPRYTLALQGLLLILAGAAVSGRSHAESADQELSTSIERL
jgi:hypothetical protein